MKNLIILLFIRYPYFRLDRKNIGHGRFANSPPPICKSARANSSIGAHQFFFVQKRLENCSWSKLNSPRSINKLTVVKLKFTMVDLKIHHVAMSSGISFVLGDL